jgi:hypothetical protein
MSPEVAPQPTQAIRPVPGLGGRQHPPSVGVSTKSSLAAGVASLDKFFPCIRKAYLVGEAADAFAAELAGKVEHVVTGTIQHALKLAARDAAAADVIRRSVCLRHPRT